MLEKITLRGEITIEARNIKTGDLLVCYSDKNMLCTGIRSALGNLLIDGNLDRHITALKVGTGTTPPTFDDVALENSIAELGSLTLAYASGVVTASATLATTQGNGVAISEYGLFGGTNKDILYARKVYPPINKTSDMTLDVTWRIYILTA